MTLNRKKLYRHITSACLSGTVGSVMRCLPTVIGESGFEARAGPIIASGYSGVCFEIKFSGRQRVQRCPL